MKVQTRGFYRAMCLAAVVSSVLPACAQRASQHTVEYYSKHTEEREAKLAECANDPGALRHDPLCVNAREAGEAAGLGSWQDLKPMGLLEAQEARERKQREAVRKESSGG